MEVKSARCPSQKRCAFAGILKRNTLRPWLVIPHILRGTLLAFLPVIKQPTWSMRAISAYFGRMKLVDIMIIYSETLEASIASLQPLKEKKQHNKARPTWNVVLDFGRLLTALRQDHTTTNQPTNFEGKLPSDLKSTVWWSCSFIWLTRPQAKDGGGFRAAKTAWCIRRKYAEQLLLHLGQISSCPARQFGPFL